jgi:hypothetical protein
MKSVALIALLSAPAAFAFIPADLKGVWSCIPEDGTYFTNVQSATDKTQFLEVDAEKEHRVVVFHKPEDKATRLFTGRSYYSYGKMEDQDEDVEEHEFVGTFTNALQADFYLEVNSFNPECVLTGGAALPGFTTDPITQGTYNCGNPSTTCTATSTGSWRGSCSNKAAGPHSFVMDDADHFTLTLDVRDSQRNHQWDVVAANHPHVFVVEKCMRGLPEKSVMCDDLQHSSYDSTEEMNEACQGTLTCQKINESSTTMTDKHCAVPKVVAPTVQYIPQPYYQPQYYQPQFYQPQVNYQPFASPQFTPNWFG